VDVDGLVTAHYGGGDAEEAILRALTAVGVDVGALTVADLAGVDDLHAGSRGATRYLLERLGLDASSRLLDVGCGLGGAVRVAAGEFGCRADGVDLTPEYVRTAAALTARVGLADRVRFHQTAGAELPFGAGEFDAATMIHVGMNIEDKAAVFAQVRRVLRDGGRFGLFEQVRVGDGPLPYPLPWALDERSSFVASTDRYAADLTAAGFEIETVEDRTEQVGGPPPPGARLTPEVVFGPDFAERIANNVAATRTGLLAPILIVARAT
jgi:MPBQ/MSBQ methyltransferase